MMGPTEMTAPTVPLIQLRLAQPEDSERIYHWRNQEFVRRFSHDTAEIPWEEHHRWFQASLKNPQRAILIGELQNKEPIGVLRYDWEASRAIVSVYLCFEKTGQGLGSQLLQAGSHWLRQYQPGIQNITAEIQPQNVASVKAFERAGYQASNQISDQGILFYECVL